VAQQEEGKGAQAASGEGAPAAAGGAPEGGAAGGGAESGGAQKGEWGEGWQPWGPASSASPDAGGPSSKAADVAPKDTSPVVFRLPLKAGDMLTAFDADDTGGAVLAILENPHEWQVSTHSP